jgi:hypothetical protein
VSGLLKDQKYMMMVKSHRFSHHSQNIGGFLEDFADKAGNKIGSDTQSHLDTQVYTIPI